MNNQGPGAHCPGAANQEEQAVAEAEKRMLPGSDVGNIWCSRYLSEETWDRLAGYVAKHRRSYASAFIASFKSSSRNSKGVAFASRLLIVGLFAAFPR